MSVVSADSINTALRRARQWASRHEHEKGVYIPYGVGIDWRTVLEDSSVPIVITNNPMSATRLCAEGQAAVAVVGVSERDLAALLQEHGARVFTKKDLL